MASRRKSSAAAVGRLFELATDRTAFCLLDQLCRSSSLRFSTLHANLPGVSTRTLTKRLRELERVGIVSRCTFRERPPRVEYCLTDAGERFTPLLARMRRWVRDNLPLRPRQKPKTRLPSKSS